MALVLSGTDVFARVSSLTTDWNYANATLLFWVKRSATNSVANGGTALALSQDASTSAESAVRTNSGNWETLANDSAGSTITAYSDDTWICLGFGLDTSGTRYAYYGTGAGITRLDTGIIINRTASMTMITLGQNAAENQTFKLLNGKFAHVRVYNATLSAAQATTEASNATTQMGASCTYAWPLIESGAAAVGSGSFSVTATSGTGTYDTDDPIGSGTSVAPLAMNAYSRMRNG